jgi:hypothetical protein
MALGLFSSTAGRPAKSAWNAPVAAVASERIPRFAGSRANLADYVRKAVEDESVVRRRTSSPTDVFPAHFLIAATRHRNETGDDRERNKWSVI